MSIDRDPEKVVVLVLWDLEEKGRFCVIVPRLQSTKEIELKTVEREEGKLVAEQIDFLQLLPSSVHRPRDDDDDDEKESAGQRERGETLLSAAPVLPGRAVITPVGLGSCVRCQERERDRANKSRPLIPD